MNERITNENILNERKKKENKDFSILIVDDEIEYLRVFSYILTSNGFSVVTASDGQSALNQLRESEIDLVMTDLKMPGMDGLTLIQKVKESYPGIEIMVITAFGTIESAVQAMKYGATGYFVKSSDPDSLLMDINRMVKIKSLEKSNQILQKQNAEDNDLFLDSKNPEILSLLETCQKAASSGINVLLLGESGVGKEVFANYIHRMSDRKDRHFIPVNCQVFAEGMVESELFGHERGSFTGALGRRIGRFEEANFGTLFLDEIGDLPLNIQGKLLRTLETKTIERVGSNRPIDLDLRRISATNKDLSREIAAGTFREDLLYRINTLTVTIPPLRRRKEDLPGLIQYFLLRIGRDQKKKIVEIAPETLRDLMEYDYPGNVRELRNILERMVALSEDGVLRGHLLPVSALPLPASVSGCERDGTGSISFPDSDSGDVCAETDFTCLRDARAAFEKNYIQRVLDRTGGNVSEAADILKITKRQLWNKISEYNLRRP